MKLRVAKKEDVSSDTSAVYFKYRSICLLSEGLLLLNLWKQRHLVELYFFSSCGKASLWQSWKRILEYMKNAYFKKTYFSLYILTLDLSFLAFIKSDYTILNKSEQTHWEYHQ